MSQTPAAVNSPEDKEKTQAEIDYEEGQKFLMDNNLSQAANAFHNALRQFEKEDNQPGIANANDKLGDLCAKRGEIDKALAFYDKVQQICETLDDEFSLFSIEKKRADLFRKAGKFEQAINRYLEILDNYSTLKNPQGSVDTLEILAEIYQESDDLDKAADAYRMIASIHKSYKHQKEFEKYTDLAQKAAGRL